MPGAAKMLAISDLEKINLRRAVPSDAPAIAPLLLAAMEDLVYEFLGIKDYAAALGFIRHWCSKPANQYSWENCFIAEQEAKLLGAANLYAGSRLENLRKPVIAWVRKHYNPGFDPEPETGPGEVYLDTLAVNPAWRNQGIGSALLRFCIAQKWEEGEEKIGLLVAADNPKAAQLYQRLGFIQAGYKSLMGKEMLHLVHFKNPPKHSF